MDFSIKENILVDKIIEQALLEDIGTGDITTESIIPSKLKAKGIIKTSEEGVVAGLDVACLVFQKLDSEIIFQEKIKMEVEKLSQIQENLEMKIDIVMLDNMNLDTMIEAVKMVKDKALIEASGGVTLKNVREIAQTGVDLISVGALTHSVKSLDISMEIV